MLEIEPIIRVGDEDDPCRPLNTETILREGDFEKSVPEPRVANAIVQLLLGKRDAIRIDFGKGVAVYSIHDIDSDSLRNYIETRILLGSAPTFDFVRRTVVETENINGRRGVIVYYPLTEDRVNFILNALPVYDIEAKCELIDERLGRYFFYPTAQNVDFLPRVRDIVIDFLIQDGFFETFGSYMAYWNVFGDIFDRLKYTSIIRNFPIMVGLIPYRNYDDILDAIKREYPQIFTGNVDDIMEFVECPTSLFNPENYFYVDVDDYRIFYYYYNDPDDFFDHYTLTRKDAAERFVDCNTFTELIPLADIFVAGMNFYRAALSIGANTNTLEYVVEYESLYGNC